MNQASTESKLQQVKVQHLELGMYVVGIAQQSHQNEIKRSGHVTSRQQIQELVSQGVLVVWVDPSRTLIKKQAEVKTESPTPTASESGSERYSNRPPQEQRIRRLYQEAKHIQGKLFKTLKKGEEVQVAELEAIADDLVDCIFDHRDALFCLARIRDKDSYLMEHSLNVGMLLANFGRFLDLERPTLRDLTIGGLLHDTGKITIPDAILHKPAKLTDDEFTIMKSHVVQSIALLKESKGITQIMMTVAGCHHERLDGRGYPRGLTREQMSVPARIMGIADVFEALTAHERPYKKPMPLSMALTIMGRMVEDRHLDPELFAVFVGEKVEWKLRHSSNFQRQTAHGYSPCQS